MPLDISELSDKEVEALQKALDNRSRSKVDWTNMTHDERAAYNKTVDPKTHQHQYFEFPKAVYGKWPDGMVKKAVVQNSSEERVLKSEEGVQWGNSPLDLGIETHPSPPAKNTRAGFEMVGMSTPRVPDEIPDVIMVTEHPAAVAAKRGRPPKVRNDAA